MSEKCEGCGHSFKGAGPGGICIGCPCPRQHPPEASSTFVVGVDEDTGMMVFENVAPTIEEIERMLLAANGREMDIESIVDGKPLGGAGVITCVYWENDELWVAVDWGMAWRVRAEGFKFKAA